MPDHIPVNDFELIVPGGPPILNFITMDGFENELETVDLPDRTTASGGNTKPIEFPATHPKHHTAEDVFLHAWHQQSVAALPGYKKACTLLIRSVSGLNVRSYNLLGMYPFKWKIADKDSENEGEMDVTEWTFKADLPIAL